MVMVRRCNRLIYRHFAKCWVFSLVSDILMTIISGEAAGDFKPQGSTVAIW